MVLKGKGEGGKEIELGDLEMRRGECNGKMFDEKFNISTDWCRHLTCRVIKILPHLDFILNERFHIKQSLHLIRSRVGNAMDLGAVAGEACKTFEL